MAAARTNRPFAEEVRRLLNERNMTVSALASTCAVSQSYLSRLLRAADYKKTPSLKLALCVAEALGVPRDYFGEYREAVVIERIRTNRRLRDHLYDSLINNKPADQTLGSAEP